MRKNFTTSLDSNILQRAKIQAIKDGFPLSKILEKLLTDYLNKANG